MSYPSPSGMTFFDLIIGSIPNVMLGCVASFKILVGFQISIFLGIWKLEEILKPDFELELKTSQH